MHDYAWVVMVDGKLIRANSEDLGLTKTPYLYRATFFRTRDEAKKFMSGRTKNKSLFYRRVYIGMTA